MSDATRGPEVTDEEILATFAGADDGRLRTREAAEELPIDEEVLLDRIQDLSERDLLRRDEDAVGDTWRITRAGAELADVPDEAVEDEIRAQATKVTGAESTTRDEETPETPPPDPQADPIEPEHDDGPDAIELFEPPGGPEEAEPRRDALRMAFAYLRNRGQADRDDLTTDVYPDARGRYDDPDDWLAELVAPGFETLPGVESLDDGGWKFTGGEEMTDR